MKHLIYAALILLSLVAPAFLQAAVPPPALLKNAPETGSVEFLAIGRPGFLKVRGTAKGPEASLLINGGQLTGTVEFAMDKLDTGIELRNQHMKEKYLQVKEHPRAKLTLQDAAVVAGSGKALADEAEKPFRALLSLHGKEKEVSGTFSVKDGTVQAKFPLKLSEFAIDLPKYLGITVAELVEVSVELPLK